MRKFFASLFVFWAASVSALQINEQNRSNPESVVQRFQAIPHRYFFCLNEDWSAGGSEKEVHDVERVFAPFFERRVLDYFIWSQCASRRIPRASEEYSLYYDFRFSLDESVVIRAVALQVKNIRIGRAEKYSNYGVFSVRVIFDTPFNKNLTTDYYLKKKNGQWVIHEIVPHGIPDGPDDSRMYQSDGILTEMLDAYINAVRNSKAAVPQ